MRAAHAIDEVRDGVIRPGTLHPYPAAFAVEGVIYHPGGWIDLFAGEDCGLNRPRSRTERLGLKIRLF